VDLFHNILAGIDLAHCERLDLDHLGPINDGVVRLASWLGRTMPARLTFLAALNKQGQPWHLINADDHDRLTRGVEERASAIMEQLVERVRLRSGVEARPVLAPGKGWVELLRQVERDRHDLVVIGSRKDSGLRRALFGRTGFHLLRNCPCPVWVTRPGTAAGPRRILVASDLSPEAEQALRLGVGLVERARGAHLHVLHLVDYPLNHLWSPDLSDAWAQAYERQVRADAERALRGQIQRAGLPPGDRRVDVHLSERAGVPDEAILEFIQARDIDLVILGTAARSGLAAFFMGNVAERLLPEVSCSLLVAKAPAE
jgi:universal stress protein E